MTPRLLSRGLMNWRRIWLLGFGICADLLDVAWIRVQ